MQTSFRNTRKVKLTFWRDWSKVFIFFKCCPMYLPLSCPLSTTGLQQQNIIFWSWRQVWSLHWYNKLSKHYFWVFKLITYLWLCCWFPSFNNFFPLFSDLLPLKPESPDDLKRLLLFHNSFLNLVRSWIPELTYVNEKLVS